MRRIIAAALVVVLTLSVLAFAAPSAHAQPTTSAAPAAHPSAGLTIASTDEFGGQTFDFYTGYAGGHVYFTSTDTNGDATGTVHIYDKNASRDGITTPAATFTVTFTGGFNASSTWGISYLIPLALPYGGQWNVTLQTTLGGFIAQNFTVHTYGVQVGTIQPAVLAGHTFGVTWLVTSTVNNSVFSGFTKLTLLASYFNGGTATFGVVPGTPANLPATSIGNFTLTAPAQATQGITIWIWANSTVGSTSQSEVGTGGIGIATVNPATVCLGDSPATITCFTGHTFANGTPVYVVAQVTMSTTFQTFPAPGLSAKFSTENNGIVVSTPGSPPGDLTTNASGGAAILFIAGVPPFSTVHPNQVVVAITDPLNPGLTIPTTTVDFAVTSVPLQLPRLQITLDSSQYYGGDTVTGSWTIWGQNTTVTGGWVADRWQVYDLSTNTVLGWGLITGTALTGTFTLTLPTTEDGTIQAYFHAHNATMSLNSFGVTAKVTAPSILLTPNEANYLPGDTVTVAVSTSGQVLSSATLYETVTDNTGVTWAAGVLTGNQIKLTIPPAGAPTNVVVSVAGQTPTGGLIAQATITLFEASGYSLAAGIATTSNYIDGSYQPGQTIEISYAISAHGTATLSKSFTVWVYSAGSGFGTNGVWSVQTTSPTGTIAITIPSNAPNGIFLFEVYGQASVCSSGCSAYAYVSVNVNPNPAVPSYQVVPGSGLTVGWIILLILIIVIAVLLLMMLRRRNRPMMMKAHDSSSPSSPPTAWKEGSPPSGSASGDAGGSAAGQPPLPPASGGGKT